MIGVEIEQLRHLIENALSQAGMSDAAWYCVAEPSRRRQPIDRRTTHRSVRVVWKKREGLLEFFDEDGCLFQTVPIAEGRTKTSARRQASGYGV